MLLVLLVNDKAVRLNDPQIRISLLRHLTLISYLFICADFSYAVIAATKKNLFIYKQNCSVSSDLRNRKTGHKFNQVGKQFLLSLNSTDEILGLHVTSRYLFVLTKHLVSIYYVGDVE